MRETRRRFPDFAKGSAGFKYRLSTVDAKDGTPVWDDGDRYWQGSIRLASQWDQAIREGQSYLEDFGSGKPLPHGTHAYYRFWVVAVCCFVLSKKGGFEHRGQGDD